MKNLTQLDLADAQFIGFNQGVIDGRIIDLITSMGLTKEEWEKWKADYTNILKDSDFEEIEEYFNKMIDEDLWVTINRYYDIKF